ncbi:hypothetical protein AGMMS50293_17220 [Spirochaetia bacterium]|nr:hypothetical protein AGMMS50293_17220 [Spirochaetia bacterium]
MAKKKKKIWLIALIVLFIAYFFTAARPIPRETILAPRWLSSLESDFPVLIGESSPSAVDFENPLPFTLGSRFGYVDSNGRFPVNQIKKGDIYLSEKLWTEYEAEPAHIEIKNNTGETALTIEDPRAYPVLLDNRIFLIGGDQNAFSEVDASGKILWTYEFAAPLTCIDAASGLVLAGSLDGIVAVLDNEGNCIFNWEPGGSRYAVILGCAISRDGSRLGIISGIDDQRFLLLERFGGVNREYKVIYHEFLEDGFRRPVHITFIDQDRWLVFEREGGIGVYDISARQGTKVPLTGEIATIEHVGGQGLFFVVTSPSAGQKDLIGIKLPDTIVIEAPFKSADAFLGRRDAKLFVGGGTTLVSFELEKK